MFPFKYAQRYSPSPETIAVIVANVLPLVGIVALGLDLASLVFLYWFELGVLSFWALVKAVFAGRLSEFDSDSLIGGELASKRTAIPVSFTDLGIRLSTLPVPVVAIPILALVCSLQMSRLSAGYSPQRSVDSLRTQSYPTALSRQPIRRSSVPHS